MLIFIQADLSLVVVADGKAVTRKKIMAFHVACPFTW